MKTVLFSIVTRSSCVIIITAKIISINEETDDKYPYNSNSSNIPFNARNKGVIMTNSTLINMHANPWVTNIPLKLQ